MECPKCSYEDVLFSAPADITCPNCGYRYKYCCKHVRNDIITRLFVRLRIFFTLSW